MNDIPEKISNTSVQVKVSRLAITGLVLSIIGTIFMTTCTFLDKYIEPSIFLFEVFSTIAIILGIISSIRIEASGGKITGEKLSDAAILLPIFTFFLTIFLTGLQLQRKIAFRIVCGSNVSNIGKQMLIYANDYDDKFPFIGNQGMSWGTSVNWDAATRQEAYGINDDGTGGSATISSSLYLLIKYMDVTPKSFICRGDKKMSEFRPEDYGVTGKSLTDFWDFGPEPWKHNSFSYQMPFGTNILTTSNEPGIAIMADRNPWMASRGWKVKDFNTFNPDGEKADIQKGNTPTHANEGQNVMYLDSHVNFEVSPLCGINEDNIYTSWNGSDIRKGTKPVFGSSPSSEKDSLLVNDSPVKKP